MITTLRETSAQKTAIQTITFRVGTCTLGLVLVATTPQGICAILLGSDEKALVGQLRSIFELCRPVYRDTGCDPCFALGHRWNGLPEASLESTKRDSGRSDCNLQGTRIEAGRYESRDR